MDDIKQALEKLYNEAIALKSTQGKLSTREIGNTILDIKEKLNEQSEKITDMEKQLGNDFNNLKDIITNTIIVINQINNREHLLANNSIIKIIKDYTALSSTFILILSLLGYIAIFIYLKSFGIKDNFYSYIGINPIPIALVFGIVILTCQIAPALYCLYLHKEKKTNNRYTLKLIPDKWEYKIYILFVFLISSLGYYIFVSSLAFSIFSALIWSASFRLIILMQDSIIKFKNHTDSRRLPLYTVILWFFSAVLSNSFTIFARPETPPFQELFTAIGFSHKNENWYKLNNKYIINNSLTQDDKSDLKNNFPNPWGNNIQDSTTEIYLYGRYIVNTKDRQIFCSLPYKENDKIKYNCKEFNTGDLYLVKDYNLNNSNKEE